jgi:hypothetical protein
VIKAPKLVSRSSLFRRRKVTFMKRVRMLVVLGAIAIALPLGLSAAHATGSHGGGGTPTNSVSIDQYADFDTFGSNIDVKLYVKCTGTTVAEVSLKQSPPETGSPVTVGVGSNPLVVCDGNTHSVGVTVGGAGFDTGWATATATLLGQPGDVVKATSTRSVYINHV